MLRETRALRIRMHLASIGFRRGSFETSLRPHPLISVNQVDSQEEAPKMALVRRILFRRSQGIEAPQGVLTSLLWSVEPAAPPEGMLRDIEGRIDQLRVSPASQARHRRTWLGAGVGLLGAIGMMLALAAPMAPQATLHDPTGAVVADIRFRGGRSLVTARNRASTASQNYVWHLWGLPEGALAPVSLGSLSSEALAVQDLDRFSGFAMSLERSTFSELTPHGMVIPLTLGN